MKAAGVVESKVTVGVVEAMIKNLTTEEAREW
jgi:hypothetical protein